MRYYLLIPLIGFAVCPTVRSVAHASARRDRMPLTQAAYRQMLAACKKSADPKHPVNRLLATAKLVTYKSPASGRGLYAIDMEPDRVAPGVECLNAKQKVIGFSGAYLPWKSYAEGGSGRLVYEFEPPRGTAYVRLQLVKLSPVRVEDRVAAAKPRTWKLSVAQRR